MRSIRNPLWRPPSPGFLFFTLLFVLPGAEDCPCEDCDSDGWTVSDGDCNDSDPAVYPQAEEICDTLDNDCDDQIDEGVTPTWYPDRDGDGYGGAEPGVNSCDPLQGYAAQEGDCDDTNPTIYPSADELCDYLDNDCNGEIDEGVTTVFYRDLDGDGFGVTDTANPGCLQSPELVLQGGDCDDAAADVNPAATEVCDGADNNCDGQTDEGLTTLLFQDQDGDTFGAPGTGTQGCDGTPGMVQQDGDCDDSVSSVNPSAVEVCDGVDNNCDEQIDEDLTAPFYPDADGDGFGVAEAVVLACEAPPGHVDREGDCDDAVFGINPDIVEVCDGLDNNCNGSADEGVEIFLFTDQDGDGYGIDGSVDEGCGPLDGQAVQAGDCDDENSEVNPGELEVCDHLDNDCDGDVDEGQRFIWRPDRDGDGFGDEDPAGLECGGGEGYVTSRGDCNDTDPAVHPGAADLYSDGKDSDCGGTDAPEPHVGFSGSSYPTIQAALAAAPTGITLWVAPGTYLEHDLSYDGKALTLSSTHGADATVVDAQALGRVFKFSTNETLGSVLRGFTLRGGSADRGGGIRVYRASPSLEELIVESNFVTIDGGGIGCGKAKPVLRDCLLRNNVATQQGGGMYADSSSNVQLERVTFLDNKGWRSGGFCGRNITMSLHDCVFDGNTSEGAMGGDARGNGGAVYLDTTSATIVSSRFVNSYSEGKGGGFYLFNSHIKLNDTHIEDNVSLADGGGMYLETSNPTLTGCVVSGNQTGGLGGGFYLYQSNPTVSSSAIEGNYAPEGAGAFLEASSPTLSDTTFSSNFSTGSGGAVYLLDSTPVFTGCVFSGNVGEDNGGGLYASNSDPTLSGCSLLANSAGYNGGGIFLSYSSAVVVNTVFSGNSAVNSGGAVLLSYSDPTLEQCTLVDNCASLGGGIFLRNESTRPSIINSVVAYNTAYNLYNDPGSPAFPSISYSNVYNPEWGSSHNLSDLETSNMSLEPGFVSHTLNGDPFDDDLHLRVGSVMVDAAAPDTFDPDGSRADIGAYGGANADWDYYRDLDEDGMYDGFEDEHGLHSSIDDSYDDEDGDGLLNGEEFILSSDPQLTDSDDDGADDLEEMLAGTDPTDFYSQPGTADTATARVPEDFESIQAAINAVRTAGIVDVAPGIWTENLRIELKKVSLVARAGNLNTVLDGGAGGPVVMVTGAWAGLYGFTVTGGLAQDGGGIHLFQSEGELSDLVVTGNLAENRGGGLFLSESDFLLSQVAVTQNSAGDEGGGMYLEQSAPNLSQCTFSGNTAERTGGGLHLYLSDATLLDCKISGNLSGVYGGAMFLDTSSPDLTRCLVAGNSAAYGGGMYFFRSSPALSTCTLSDNLAEQWGGAAYLQESAPSLQYCALVRNSALSGGGLYLKDRSTTPGIRNTILAFNAGYNLYNDTRAPGSPSVTYSDLYNPEGWQNHNLSALDPSNLEGEPGFLLYDAGGYPSDLHLALDSSLVNAGDPSLADADGSRSDIGVFGGVDGALWDLDQDGFFDYFWPGSISDAPQGVDAAAYDCDDSDSSVRSCP